VNPRLTPWANICRAARRSTSAEQAAEFEKRKLCATPLVGTAGTVRNARERLQKAPCLRQPG
jgi:hypothetical protein